MRRVSHGLIALLVFACTTIMAVRTIAQENPEAKKLKNPVPATAESVKAGEAVFQKFCKFCHGADAKGNGPMAPKGTHPPNLIDEAWDHGSSDGEIFTIILNGSPPTGTPPKPLMVPNKGKISDQDIWNLVNYIRSLGPKAKSH